MKKRSLLNIAWLGQGDFGDEAMAYALRSSLRSRLVSPPSYYQKGVAPAYRGVDDISPPTSLHSFKTPERLRRLIDPFLLRNIDTVFIGGGSLFHSENSIRWKHKIVQHIRKKFGSRALVALLGVSVGPFASQDAEQGFRALLHDVDLCMTRDSRSAEIIRTHGFGGELHDAVDLSFLLPQYFDGLFPRTACHHDSQKCVSGLMFVHRRGDAQFETDGNFERYLSVINLLLDKGQKVKLFTLYTGDSYCDRELNEALREKAKDPDRVSIHEFNGDILRTTQAIAHCNSILSMRLHGIIFSYLTGVPFVSLGYDPKNQNFCDTVGYSKEYVFEIANKPTPQILVERLEDVRMFGDKCFDGTLLVADGARKLNSALDSLVARINTQGAGSFALKNNS